VPTDDGFTGANFLNLETGTSSSPPAPPAGRVHKDLENHEIDLNLPPVTKHDTFKDACIAMGLLANDNEWHQALEETVVWASGRQLRDMFASMLMFCEVTNP